jgi:hypothetical protein
MPGDELILLHVISASAQPAEANAMLATFSNVMTDAQTKRRVTTQVISLL